ncbi:hypothetical protein ANCDUO_01310 [Ancylostoma duodenale]|uniref:Uncharacterized protein n=1 Tax=Ancylostoma duodenale TaxID=51022 RepID=A0A0C2DEJ9_9BILA|nr:hypothetical protein ANCDUO_01310 [Ancylostoma duodenale]
MQARKIRYDVIGLTETRRHRPLNATFDTGEELFFGTCDSRGVGGVGVLVNTNLIKNIDSFEQLTTRIGRLRLRRCGSMPAVIIFVAYAPTSSYDEEEIEAFFTDLGKFYREDHTFYKSPKPVVNWGLFTSLAGFWEDAVVDNIDEKYDRLVQHLRDSAKKAEGSRTTKRHLSYETSESRRQLPANVRARKTVQRSDKRRPQGEKSSSVGRSRRGREKHSQCPPRLRQPQDQDRVMLGITRLTQVRAGIRSSTLRQQSKIRDAAAYVKLSKIRWAGHVMRLMDNRRTRAVSDWTPRNVKRTTGRPPTPWSDFFTKSFKERYNALRVPHVDRIHWTTLERERDKWKDCWRPLGISEDQQESR